MRRMLRNLAVLVGTATTLAGCSAGSGSDGVTFICTPQEDWCQLIQQKFTEATGVNANYVRLSGGEALARLTATGASPEFDAWFGGGAEGHQAAADRGFLDKYVSPNAAIIPEEYKDPDQFWTGVYVGVLGFCSNTDVLKKVGVEAPKSWQDLLNPRLKWNIAMAHPGTSGTAYQAVWTQVDLHNGDKNAAIDYFRNLHSNILQYSKTGSAPGRMAGRGEIATGIVFAQDCQKYINEGFSTLQTTVPSEGTGYEVGAVSLIKGARNSEAAKKFIDWTLTPQAQELASNVKTYSIPSNPGAKHTADMVDLTKVKLLHADIKASGAAREALTKRFDTDVAPKPKG
ncbi:ABC transporter substrate-binding protein [Tsukamurella sp. 1534]|uniref:ABC transporter substrate-binding protein n=1 Tax=Tsukamurella sp. 1534 TaxID=1151061 RepID=UPI000592AA9F|nr:ABC transporter substrate-binding protein [Tsukamurella sp. 1534]